MSRSGTNLSARISLLQPKRFVSGLRNARRSQDDSEEREHLIAEEHPTPQLPHRLPSPPQFDPRNSTPPDPDDAYLSRCYAQMARDIIPSLPPTCRRLSPEDVIFVSEHPIAAGGFTNIHEATHAGRGVVLKSHRCYVLFDIAQVIERFLNEVRIWTLLRRRGVDVVPLLGVYSAGVHHFGLVYEYMAGLDLRQYLSNKPNAGRLKLLVGVARCLYHMHDLEIVYGHLQLTNILVDADGTARIAGLGNAIILPYSTARAAEGRIAKANDMYDFGFVAWEVFTIEITATRSIMSGSMPSRPNHSEVSDIVWQMIKSCLQTEASRRVEIGEVVTLLEAEMARALVSGA